MSYNYGSSSSYNNNNSFGNNNNNNNNTNNREDTSPLREVPLFQSVRIRVGMKIIYTTMHTLQQSPTSVLAQLFSPPFPLYDELEEIHRFPQEYVSEVAFLQIIDCLRSGEWVPCKTTEEREELLRAVATLEIRDLPDIPLAADHSVMIAEGGTQLFYQHAVSTENIKDLRKKLEERLEKQKQYAKKKKEATAAKSEYDAAENEYSRAQSVADQYRKSADEASDKFKNLESKKKDVLAKFDELTNQKAEISARLDPLQEDNDEKQRDARKSKFAHVQQMELSDAAADAAKAAEQPQPNGADPIKDETLEEAATEAQKVTDEAKIVADEKAKLAAESQEKFMAVFQEMEKFQLELDQVVAEKEELEQTAGSSASEIEERLKLADEAEKEAKPLKETRDDLKKKFDDLDAECERIKPKSPEEEEAETRKEQELHEEKIFIEEPHPQSILPFGSPRIIPRQVRKLGLKGYRVRGEARGDIDLNPQPLFVNRNLNSNSSSNQQNPISGGGIGGGGPSNFGRGGGFGGFGGNPAIRRGGFGHRTIGGTNNSSSHQNQNNNFNTTTSLQRSLPQYNNNNDRGVSEVSTAQPYAGNTSSQQLIQPNNNNNNNANVAPFSGSRNQVFCDTTTLIMEKELERLDYLMMLAYESPSGDFFRQKKPTGALQELIDSCVL